MTDFDLHLARNAGALLFRRTYNDAGYGPYYISKDGGYYLYIKDAPRIMESSLSTEEGFAWASEEMNVVEYEVFLIEFEEDNERN